MKILLSSILSILCFCFTVHTQAVYVDSNLGNDKNPGTKEAPVVSIKRAAEIIHNRDNGIYIMKINPGIYILDSHISIATEKPMTDKRIIIEAAVLPDDTSWSPEKMPVVTCKAMKGEIPDKFHWVVSFLVDESHVTLRGIKFTGYFHPNSRYYPIARLNKTKTDLSVEQCLFTGETEGSPIQVGVIAHGDEIKIDHCIFYKVRNTVVYFEPSVENGIKTGNSLTNSIIYGANQAVWTSYPDENFTFKNNIVSNCRYVWVKSDINPTKYTIENCVIVNNKYYTGVPDNAPVPLTPEKKFQLRLRPRKFEIDEKNVTKKDQISLRLTDSDDLALLFGIDGPLPKDYMHVLPGTLGFDIGAGLFKYRNK